MEQNYTEYTVVVNGKPEGPYRLEQLEQLQIEPGTFVRKPGMDDYKEAHEFSELRVLLGFTYQHTAPQYFAAFDQRLLAWAIDYFFIVLGFVVILLIVFLLMNDKEGMMFWGMMSVFFIPLVKLLYASFAESSIRQATIGKRLLNIKVTDMTGNRLSFSVSLLRNLFKVISTAPLFFGYLYSFLNKKQQCFHDVLSNTLVIKDRLI